MGHSKYVRNANKGAYHDDPHRDQYIREEYHWTRTLEALRLLCEGLGELNPGKTRKILDLGPGGCIALGSLVKKGYKVFAADLEIGVARDVRLHIGSRVVVMDASMSAIRSNAIDAILMGELIEHVFDTEQLLRECFRVIAPEGRIVITTPNLAIAQDRVRFLIGRSPRQLDPFHPYRRLHIRPFTLDSLCFALRRVGFSVEQWTSNFVEWKLRSIVLRSRFLARIFPTLGGSLIVKATKKCLQQARVRSS